MTKETEAKQLLADAEKVLKALEAEKDEAKRADIVLGHFATLAKEDPKELIAILVDRMSRDISPNDKDPMFIKGMQEGIMLSRASLEEHGVMDIQVIQQLGVAYATLVKMLDKLKV